MGVIQLDILGSPNIGVYSTANDKFCLIPFGITSIKMAQIRDCLNVEVHPFGIAGSILNGAFTASNSSGIVIPRIISKEELEPLKKMKDLSVLVLKSRKTALGNLILVNDRGAVVDPRFSAREIKQLTDVFNVEVVKGEIYGFHYIGSLAVATNKGIITHPRIKENEKKLLEETLKVESDTGTVNGGVPFPRQGMIVNSQGVITGPLTTGFELAAITRTFGL